MMSNGKDENVVPFETALDRAGFGCYSYLLVSLSGLIIIGFVCVVYNSTIVVPASACELNTTSAQQGLLASAPVIGLLIGTLIWGYLADTRGRRKMLLLSLFLGAVVNAISSISVNWIMLMILQFLASMLVAGQFAMTMTLLSECVPLAKRNLVVLLVTCIFLLGQGTMAGFGLYSYLLTTLTGLIIIAFACVVHSNTVLIPIIACDLNPTLAEQGLLAAMPNIGNIIGAGFWGYLADTRGRRAMLLVSLMMGAVSNVVASMSADWIMLLVVQFIGSILVAGQFPLSMTLLSECVPLVKRNLVVIIVTSMFLLSQGLMAVMAIPLAPATRDVPPPGSRFTWSPWRDIMLLYALPSLVCFGWMFHMQESPKYVFRKGEEFKAIQILDTIHRINHRKSITKLDVTGLALSQTRLSQTPAPAGRIRPLFKPPLVKNLFLITTLFLFQLIWPFKIWLPKIANQFIIILNTGKGVDHTLCGIIGRSLKEPRDTSCTLNVTALMLVFFVGALQSVVNILVSPLVNKLGRRNMVMVITFICGFCGIMVNLVPNAYGSATLFTCQLLGMIVMGYYTAIAVSLFPTHNRAMGVTIAVTGGRVSTFISVQLLNFLLATYCEVGFFVFSAIFALSSLVASLLPKERAHLPKTIRRFSPKLFRSSVRTKYENETAAAQETLNPKEHRESPETPETQEPSAPQTTTKTEDSK